MEPTSCGMCLLPSPLSVCCHALSLKPNNYPRLVFNFYFGLNGGIMYSEEERKKKNKDLLDRMKKGENLSSFSKEESWFPRRPSIPKDQEAIEKLYGKDPDKHKPKPELKLV